MIHVTITAADIAVGERRECYSCPVALALARATGDEEANVYERDWFLWLEAWGRSIRAPEVVRDFVRRFDDDETPEPFAFSLPDQTDPAWQERCCRCDELFPPAELDDTGVCEECRTCDEAGG